MSKKTSVMVKIMFVVLASVWLATSAWQPAAVAAPAATGTPQNFGPSLVKSCPNPEGIAVDPTGNIYASSFASTPTANICVVNSAGALVDVIPVAAGSGGVTSLLGMLFVPSQGLYVLDFANGAQPNGRVLHVDPATHAVTTIATGFAAPNGVAQDNHGALFVSDSFTGEIRKVAPDGTSNTLWVQSELLKPHGFPPFGANGVAFDRTERFLYIANTADDRVLRVPVQADGSAGKVEIFADGATINATQKTTHAIDGADGIAFDVQGNLYVCANQANEIQVLSPSGALVTRYAGTGAAALDFPASLVFKGRSLFITNLSLFDGGINSKLSVLEAPLPGAPLRP
ncbi:MAG TPA: SMP-30/gluconolactonase/LRE family protein [Anaerolineae bacterium]